MFFKKSSKFQKLKQTKKTQKHLDDVKNAIRRLLHVNKTAVPPYTKSLIVSYKLVLVSLREKQIRKIDHENKSGYKSENSKSAIRNIKCSYLSCTRQHNKEALLHFSFVIYLLMIIFTQAVWKRSFEVAKVSFSCSSVSIQTPACFSWPYKY